jgi:hypothetical protein
VQSTLVQSIACGQTFSLGQSLKTQALGWQGFVLLPLHLDDLCHSFCWFGCAG